MYVKQRSNFGGVDDSDLSPEFRYKFVLGDIWAIHSENYASYFCIVAKNTGEI